MHLFYHPSAGRGLLTLDISESAHCTKVLRLAAGSVFYLTDGKGMLCKARLVKPDPKACVAEVTEISHLPAERPGSLHIAIAPTKRIERFEWFLEKATEIGIDRIIPLYCGNSERRVIKAGRLEKVLVSAMKQSFRAWLPELALPEKFENLVGQPFGGNRFIAAMQASPSAHLGKVYEKGADTLILIGPEGDFRNEEIETAKEAGIIPVSLGTTRLRTETAGLVACHTVNLVNFL
jgi:16S rRNA (uracil1498-N3)-methyltransferase